MRRLWVLPVLCAAGGAVLSVATVALDAATGYDAVPRSLTGPPSAAQSVLQVVAQSVFTLSGFVLTLTLVAVQLAMGQFSPRIVGALLADRRSQLAIGLFLGTFAFALLGMRGLDAPAGHVAGITILTAYGLALACIVVLMLYVHHAGQTIRVAGLIDLVGEETRRQLVMRYPAREPERADEGAILAERAGVVVAIDEPGLIEEARRGDTVIELAVAMGEFVAGNGLLARARGNGHVNARRVRELVALGGERTHESDPPYGIRKLVDIAARSCKEPFDDPTTTVQALHRIHDCLRLLVTREIPDGRHFDAGGELRLVVPVLGWDGFVRLAFDEVRLAGARSPQVARRLRAALVDILDVAPPERRAPLERQLRLLDAAVERSYDDAEDVDAARVPDREGIGGGADVEIVRA
jgi:uncharacterized membrane protein